MCGYTSLRVALGTATAISVLSPRVDSKAVAVLTFGTKHWVWCYAAVLVLSVLYAATVWISLLSYACYGRS
eukprot:558509-Rhodomonas_salina.1